MVSPSYDDEIVFLIDRANSLLRQEHALLSGKKFPSGPISVLNEIMGWCEIINRIRGRRQFSCLVVRAICVIAFLH